MKRKREACKREAQNTRRGRRKREEKQKTGYIKKKKEIRTKNKNSNKKKRVRQVPKLHNCADSCNPRKAKQDRGKVFKVCSIGTWTYKTF